MLQKVGFGRPRLQDLGHMADVCVGDVDLVVCSLIRIHYSEQGSREDRALQGHRRSVSAKSALAQDPNARVYLIHSQREGRIPSIFCFD